MLVSWGLLLGSSVLWLAFKVVFGVVDQKTATMIVSPVHRSVGKMKIDCSSLACLKLQVQNMTNQFVASIDKVCSAKEKELHVL